MLLMLRTLMKSKGSTISEYGCMPEVGDIELGCLTRRYLMTATYYLQMRL